MILLAVASGLALGCSPNVIFVRALEAPKWPVSQHRTIGVAAIVEGKHGIEAQLTRDLAAILKEKLDRSAYYERAARQEVVAGDFEEGETGQRIPAKSTIAESAEEAGTGLLLYLEVLDAEMGTTLGPSVGYGMGFGRSYGRTSMGIGFREESSCWNVQARMLISITLADAASGTILKSTVEGHSFYRSYSDMLPSESTVFGEILGRVTSRLLTYVDVYYQLSPRFLLTDGSSDMADGNRYAILGTPQDWEKAGFFWSKAYERNRESVAANYSLGIAAEMREDYRRAAAWYQAAQRLSGDVQAFAKEIDEASHSAEVLERFGSPEKAPSATPGSQEPPGENPAAPPAPEPDTGE
jgi:hypothetical protein